MFARQLRAFQQGLNETGYVEGRNVAIEYRWAEGKVDRLLPLAADLVSRRVAAIATSTDTAALATKAATTVDAVPVAFLIASDPVARGLVASLARPGRNLTGVTSLNIGVGPKRLEMMHELFPRATSAALLVNPANPTSFESITKETQAAARTLGL